MVTCGYIWGRELPTLGQRMKKCCTRDGMDAGITLWLFESSPHLPGTFLPSIVCLFELCFSKNLGSEKEGLKKTPH